MTPEDWARIYRDALPQQLRPRLGVDRLTLAALDALSNGHAPRALAVLVARQNYSGANSPAAVALAKLEELAARPAAAGTPRPGRGRQRNNGCLVCAWHMDCPDPIREADLIPDEWTRERFQLLHELMRIPSADMSEDEREEAMCVLIADQRARGQT
jgi:hypothetical protein